MGEGAGRSVVMTGVSTGIGRATAHLLLSQGFHVFGSVRRLADAQELQSQFRQAFRPLLFDVTDEEAVTEAVHQVRSALGGQRLWALINNAGVAWPGPVLHQNLMEIRKTLDINFFGAVLAMQAFLPLLGTDHALKGAPGRIINISSVGGKYGAPFMGAYAASKHALEGMSDSLRRELLLYGVDVIIIGPGNVRTPIWEKARAFDLSSYAGTEYALPLQKFVQHMVGEGQRSHTPEHIARTIVKAVQSSKPAVRYAVVHKPLINWVLPRWLPARWVDAAMADAFGLKQQQAKQVLHHKQA